MNTKNVVLSFLKSSTDKDKQLEIGIKVEKEHTDVYNLLEDFLKKHDLKMPLSRKDFFEYIARAHISEVKDYYDKLIKHVEKHAMDFSSISPLLEPGNPLDERELVRAIRLALSAEEDAASLYELIADATKNSMVKDVMNDIANEEKVHKGELQKILFMLDKKEKESLEEGAKEVEEKL